MANERRLIDANALTNTIEGMDWYSANLRGKLVQGAKSVVKALYKADEIYKTIEDAPTVDAIIPVRCKDCKYYYDRASIFAGRRITLCAKYNQGLSCPKPDDFCSYGEAKSGTQPQREDV